MIIDGLFTGADGLPLAPVVMDATDHMIAVLSVVGAAMAAAVTLALINAPPRDPNKPKKKWWDHFGNGPFPPSFP